MKCFMLFVLLFATDSILAQQTPQAPPADNPELTQVYTIDQSEREGANVDWTALYKHDIERRVRLRQLLLEGKVQSGVDYFHAAMILQHGQNPDEYLLAHLLAVTAISKGNKEARWLSAATLDRYLRSIWQPQVYGTQFSKNGDGPWAHDLMNEKLVSDSMRNSLCVSPFVKQQEALPKPGSKDSPGRTSIADCE